MNNSLFRATKLSPFPKVCTWSPFFPDTWEGGLKIDPASVAPHGGTPGSWLVGVHVTPQLPNFAINTLFSVSVTPDGPIQQAAALNYQTTLITWLTSTLGVPTQLQLKHGTTLVGWGYYVMPITLSQ